MNQVENPLRKYRDEIDALDVEIQELLARRAAVVEKLASLKEPDAPKMRPGREAQILRGLIARHKGSFPRPELIRIWREILSATTRLQGPFSVAAFVSDEDARLLDLARDHYGAYTPMTGHKSLYGVIQAIAEGEATVGVLPMPAADEANPWWCHLAVEAPAGATDLPPRIVARLPFAPGGEPRAEALAIACMAPEESGDDRSYVAIELSEDLSMPRLRAALSASGLEAAPVARWHDSQAPERWLHLAECKGFVAPGNGRLSRLADEIGKAASRLVVLGAYATPLGADQLQAASARRGRRPRERAS